MTIATDRSISPAQSEASSTSNETAQRLSQEVLPVLASERTAGGSIGNPLVGLVPMVENLPSNFSASSADINQFLNTAGIGQSAARTSILNGIESISRNGPHVTVDRNSPEQIPLNQTLVQGAINLKSFNIGNLSFDLEAGKGKAALNNINGLSLTFTAFGKEATAPIRDVTVRNDSKGDSFISGVVATPLPKPLVEMLDMGPSVPVNMEITASGQIVQPMPSDVLKSAAQSTGNSLPGMIVHDELENASQIAEFAHNNSAWVQQTMLPAFESIAQYVTKPAPGGHDNSQPSKKPEVPAPNAFVSDRGSEPAKQSSEMPPLPSKIEHSGDYSATITVGGQKRDFIVHVPPGYDPSKPVPMVLALHGLNGSAQQFEQQSGFNQESDKGHFIVVYPDANKWYGGHWSAWDTGNGLMPGEHAPDVAYLSDVIDQMQKTANIDPKRIYMAGLSNGAMMTFAAAGPLSGKLAAIATISGAMSGYETSPTEPLSIIDIHGTADPTIPYNGVSNVPGVLTEIGVPTFNPHSYTGKYWTKEDKISGSPQVSQKGKQTFEIWNNKADGAEVEQVTNIGGKHVPSNKQQVDDEVWNFFSQHPKIKLTSGDTPPVVSPRQSNAEDPVAQLEQDVHKRGVKGLEADADRELAIIPTLQNGSVDPAQYWNEITDKLDTRPNDPVSNFLKSTTDVSKDGNHIAIDRTDTAHIPLNFSVAGGLAKLDSLDIGTSGFDLNTDKGLVQLNNIKGIGVSVDALGFKMSSNIKNVSETVEGDGTHIYSVDATQPLPSWARIILGAPNNINIDVKVDPQGKPVVTNEGQVMNDTLGYNPLTRGSIYYATDAARLFTHPSVGSAFGFVKDLGITAAATYLGARFGGRLGGTAGFFAAPMVVDGVDQI